MPAKVETVRIEYSLPTEHRNQFAGWQQSDSTRFPDDRAFQSQVNRAELAAKAEAGLIRRRMAS